MVLPFLTIYLNTLKGYSLSLTGFVMMGYGIGSFFGNWAGGILSEKIGPFRLQFFSLLSSGIAYYVLLYLDSPWAIGAGLFACSFLADAFRPANMASVALLSGPKERIKAVGVTRLAFNLGFIAGPALGGLIAANLGYDWIFIIDGSSCLFAGLIFFIFFRKYIVAESIKTKNQDLSEEPKPYFRQILNDRPFMLFMLLLFVYGIVFMQFFITVPVYFKNVVLLSEDYIGMLMALNGFLIVLIELPLIQFLEKKGQMRMMALGTLMVGGAYLFLLPVSPLVWVWIASIVFTMGEVFSFPFVTTIVLNRGSEKMRARYMALYGMTFSLCHIVAPAFGMAIADFAGFSVLWVVLALMLLFVAWGYYRLKNEMEQPLCS